MEPQDDYEYQCKFTPYTSMINVLGLPAISVPIKDDEDGMSWSIQAVGRAGTEDMLLRLGARLEALVAANKRPEENCSSRANCEPSHRSLQTSSVNWDICLMFQFPRKPNN